MAASDDPVSKLVLIGGFLGAGKTTLIAQLAGRVMDQGYQVGIVTNDQGSGLVDTVTAQSLEKAAVSEVTGGCFCCRLDDLVEKLGDHLEGREGPVMLLAEPVGSCTDLMATVILPLKERYDLALEIAPFSVVLDARRALAALGGRRRRRDFSKDVGYIYRKQIEEAQCLVVNKIDLLSEADLADLQSRLNDAHPEKRVFSVSGLTGDGCGGWLSALSEECSEPDRPLAEIDYSRYGEGEALLGWLNTTLRLASPESFDPDAWLQSSCQKISSALSAACVEVAHLKLTLEASDRPGQARVHQVMSEDEPQFAALLSQPVTKARVLVNLRAEGDPELLERFVRQSLEPQAGGPVVEITELSAFRPGQPVPVHRIAHPANA